MATSTSSNSAVETSPPRRAPLPESTHRMADQAVHVVVVVLDGLSPRCATPSVTPGVHRLASTANGRPGLGVVSLLASASPAHATLATGRSPFEHGVLAEAVWHDGRFVPASTVGPVGTSLFGACARRGLPTIAVLGSARLVNVLDARAADRCWPFDGRTPDDLAVAGDDLPLTAVLGQLDAAMASLGRPPALTMVHLAGPGAAARRHGPESAEAIAAYHEADAAASAVVARFAPMWDRTVVVLLSDHGYEAVLGEPVDLVAAVEDRAPGWAIHVEGGGALAVRRTVRGHGAVGGDDAFDFTSIDGVEGDVVVTPGVRVLWSSLGRPFLPAPGSADRLHRAPCVRGVHGGPRAAGGVVAVGGGHPAAVALSRVVAGGPVRAVDWAPTVAALLGVHLPSASGLPLVAPAWR